MNATWYKSWITLRVWSGWCCIAVACAGLLVLGGLGLRVVQAGDEWYRFVVAWPALPMAAPTAGAEGYRRLFAGLEALVLQRPWIWPLLGALGLLLRTQGVPVAPTRVAGTWKAVAIAGLLALALVAGARVRLAPLWSAPAAVESLDYDEGVYVSAARMWLGGYMPYRDMWLSHPPMGIAMLMPAALGADGPQALVAARRTTAALDLLTGLLIAWAGFELGGWGVGIIAAALYLLDSTAGSNSTHVWLEGGINLWSAAALGCALRGLRRDQYRWLIAAGVLAIMAVMTKYIGAALLVALVAGLAATRRWRMASALLLGAGLALLLFAAASLPFGWEDMLRQTLIAQLLRAPYQITTAERAALVFDAAGSLPTVIGATLGMIAVLLLRPARSSGWAIVFIWLAAVLVLFASSPVFYLHYITQVIPPLALLGGGLALLWQGGRRRKLALAAGGLALLGPFVLLQQLNLPTGKPSTALVASAQTIRERTPAGQPLLAFEPLYNLLSDRPFMRAPDGRLLIDSYMHLEGLRIDWSQSPWVSLWQLAVLKQPLPLATQTDPVEQMLTQAPAAVFDQFRPPGGIGQVTLLASEYRQYPLAIATLYERTQQLRHFSVESLRVRGLLVPTVVAAGSELPVSVLWQMQRPEPRRPSVSLQLLGADQHKWGQFDKLVGPGGAPFWSWQPGHKIYEDTLAVAIDPHTPPGTYQLCLIVYDQASGKRWSLTSDDGQPLGDMIVVENVTVTGP